MLKKILCLLFTLGLTAYATAIPANIHPTTSHLNFDLATQQIIDLVRNKCSLDEIRAIIESAAVQTEQEGTYAYVTQLKISRDQIFCFALGASLGIVIVALASSGVYAFAVHTENERVKSLAAKQETLLQEALLREEKEKIQKQEARLAELQQTEAKLSKLTSELNTARERIATLEPQLFQAQNNLKQTVEEATQLRTDLENSRKAVDEIEEQIEQLSQPYWEKIAIYNAELKSFFDETNNLFVVRKKETEENKHAKKNIPQELINQFNQPLQDLKEKHENAKKTEATLEKLCSNYETDIKEFETLLNDLEAANCSEIKNKLNSWAPSKENKANHYKTPLEQLQLKKERREKMKPVFDRINSEKKDLSQQLQQVNAAKDQAIQNYQLDIDKLEIQRDNQYKQEKDRLNQKILDIKQQRNLLEKEANLAVAPLLNSKAELVRARTAKQQKFEQKCEQQRKERLAKNKIQTPLLSTQKHEDELRKSLLALETKKQQLAELSSTQN